MRRLQFKKAHLMFWILQKYISQWNSLLFSPNFVVQFFLNLKTSEYNNKYIPKYSIMIFDLQLNVPIFVILICIRQNESKFGIPWKPKLVDWQIIVRNLGSHFIHIENSFAQKMFANFSSLFLPSNGRQFDPNSIQSSSQSNQQMFGTSSNLPPFLEV